MLCFCGNLIVLWESNISNLSSKSLIRLIHFVPPLKRGWCSQISHVPQITRYHERNCTPFRLCLEENHKMRHQNNQTFAPVLSLRFFPFPASLLVYLPVAVKKQQLVTPYGGEWRGRFEHLPAWTPPYAVESDCLLSLLNEKSNALFFLFQFLTCFSPCWPEETYSLTFTSGSHLLPSCQGGKFAKSCFVGSTCLGLFVRRLPKFWHFSSDEEIQEESAARRVSQWFPALWNVSKHLGILQYGLIFLSAC